MSLAFSACSAVAAAVCGWPASAAIERLGRASDVAGSPTADGDAPNATRPRAARPWLLALLLAASAWAITVRLHPALVAVAACWLTACGVPLAVIDVRTRRLPDTLTAASLAGVVGFLALTANWQDVATAGAGGLAVGAFFVLLALTRPSSAGLGDAKLGLSTGGLVRLGSGAGVDGCRVRACGRGWVLASRDWPGDAARHEPAIRTIPARRVPGRHPPGRSRTQSRRRRAADRAVRPRLPLSGTNRRAARTWWQLARRPNLRFGQAVATAAAFGRENEDVADPVPVQSNLAEDADPLRLGLHVDEYRADSLLPDVGLELGHELLGGVRETLHWQWEIGPHVDRLIDVSAR